MSFDLRLPLLSKFSFDDVDDFLALFGSRSLETFSSAHFLKSLTKTQASQESWQVELEFRLKKITSKRLLLLLLLSPTALDVIQILVKIFLLDTPQKSTQQNPSFLCLALLHAFGSDIQKSHLKIKSPFLARFLKNMGGRAKATKPGDAGDGVMMHASSSPSKKPLKIHWKISLSRRASFV